MEEKVEIDKDNSMNMKLCISNLPKFVKVNEIKKWLVKNLELPIDSIACRKAPKWDYAYVTVSACEQLSRPEPLQAYAEKLKGIQWKNKRLVASVKEGADRMAFKRAAPESIKSLADQVTPLWKLDYAEQLAQKSDHLRKVLEESILDFSPACMKEIHASPLQRGYRNKCEFTIGLDKEGKPTVGFLLGMFRDGIVMVENADDCLHVPQAMKDFANHLQTFIRDHHLELPPYDRCEQKGFWRLALVRIHDDQMMVALQVSESFFALSEKCKEYMDKITDHVSQFNKNSSIPIKSFFIQKTNGKHNGIDLKAPFALQFGSPTLTQTLLGLSFQISPLSFFQVNIQATEILFTLLRKLVVGEGGGEESKHILLDLCCGTGTIGMMLAHKVHHVYGVEIVKEAIANAKINMDLNGIKNMTFECNPVEKAIEKLISTLPPNKRITVVLDPPRNGVHYNVIKAVRKCDRIGRVIFVACNAEAASKNFSDLTRPISNTLLGAPFTLDQAVPVDLFPMTKHCELLLQFNRNQ